MNIKIAQCDADRKILEDKVDYENKTIKTRMDEIEKSNVIQTSIFNNLKTHTHEVMDELS